MCTRPLDHLHISAAIYDPQSADTYHPRSAAPATFTPQALNARNFPPAALHLGSPVPAHFTPRYSPSTTVSPSGGGSTTVAGGVEKRKLFYGSDVAIKPEAPEKPSQPPQPLSPKVDASAKEIESLKWQVHEVTASKDYYQNLAQFYQEWAGKKVTRACQLTIKSGIRQQEIQTAISRLQRLTLEVGNKVKEYGEKARDRHNEGGKSLASDFLTALEDQGMSEVAEKLQRSLQEVEVDERKSGQCRYEDCFQEASVWGSISSRCFCISYH